MNPGTDPSVGELDTVLIYGIPMLCIVILFIVLAWHRESIPNLSKLFHLKKNKYFKY